MAYTLEGDIAKAHPNTLDKTLTLEDAAAEAKATGEAIAEAKRLAENHSKNNSNPHKVTKGDVGLGNVDNTSDADKPVSTAQARAIADAKKAGTDAMAVARNTLSKEGGIMGGSIEMSNHRITGLAVPEENNDAVSKIFMEDYIHDTFLGGAW